MKKKKKSWSSLVKINDDCAYKITNYLTSPNDFYALMFTSKYFYNLFIVPVVNMCKYVVFRVNNNLNISNFTKKELKYYYVQRLKLSTFVMRFSSCYNFKFLSNRFPNMHYLDISNNKVIGAHERVAGLKNLTYLDFGNNEISSIKGLSHLINLQVLILYNNNIKKICDLEKLTNLRHLCLCCNKIKKIEGLSTQMNLEVLHLGQNKIRKIENLYELKNLQELDLSENKITDKNRLHGLVNLKKSKSKL